MRRVFARCPRGDRFVAAAACRPAHRPQISLTPPGAQQPPPAPPLRQRSHKLHPKAQAPPEGTKLRRRADTPAPKSRRACAKAVTSSGAKENAPSKAAAPAPDNPNADLAYGAYQEGLYRTAFNLRDETRAGNQRSQIDDAAGANFIPTRSVASATMPRRLNGTSRRRIAAIAKRCSLLP